MAWDTARTKRLLLEAAVAEFSEHGPQGARVARIAERAGINKERIYQYFGNKDGLFVAALSSELAKAADAVPLTAEHLADLGEYAGTIYDYQQKNPHLLRLMSWEGLAFGDSIVGRAVRADFYADKIAVLTDAQRTGEVSAEVSPEQIVYALIALTSFWSTLPHLGRLMLPEAGDAGPRADIVAVVRRLTRP